MDARHHYGDDRVAILKLPKCLIADLLDLPPGSEIITVADAIHDTRLAYDTIAFLVRSPDLDPVGDSPCVMNTVRPTYKLDVGEGRVRQLTFVSWEWDSMLDFACRNRTEGWNGDKEKA